MIRTGSSSSRPRMEEPMISFLPEKICASMQKLMLNLGLSGAIPPQIQQPKRRELTHFIKHKKADLPYITWDISLFLKPLCLKN